MGSLMFLHHEALSFSHPYFLLLIVGISTDIPIIDMRQSGMLRYSSHCVGRAGRGGRQYKFLYWDRFFPCLGRAGYGYSKQISVQRHHQRTRDGDSAAASGWFVLLAIFSIAQISAL
jgi:hypothetical protein